MLLGFRGHLLVAPLSCCHHGGINGKVHTLCVEARQASRGLDRGQNRWVQRAEGGLVSNWAAEFPHLTRRGSVCSPTLRVFCQHQLCDIYSLLPHVPRQPLDTAPVLPVVGHPACISAHDQQNPTVQSVVKAAAGEVRAETEPGGTGMQAPVGPGSEAWLVFVRLGCQPWRWNMISPSSSSS